MSKPIAVSIILLCVALLVDIGLRVKQQDRTSELSNRMGPFEIVSVLTNDSRGLVIIERKTSTPIWGAWNLYTNNGLPDTVSFFFGGRNIMNLHREPHQPPVLDVAFFGEDGAVRAIWISRGNNAGFTSRVVYDEGEPRKDIWYDGGWHTLEHRTNDGIIYGGITIDGKWQRVMYTNGANVILPYSGRQPPSP